MAGRTVFKVSVVYEGTKEVKSVIDDVRREGDTKQRIAGECGRKGGRDEVEGNMTEQGERGSGEHEMHAGKGREGGRRWCDSERHAGMVAGECYCFLLCVTAGQVLE